MPTGTKGNYDVGYGKPPRNAGFKKSDDVIERRAERAGDDHRERPAPRDRQARGGDQIARQQIRVRSSRIFSDHASEDAEPRGASALFGRSSPRRRPGGRGGPGPARGEARGAIRHEVATER